MSFFWKEFIYVIPVPKFSNHSFRSSNLCTCIIYIYKLVNHLFRYSNLFNILPTPVSKIFFLPTPMCRLPPPCRRSNCISRMDSSQPAGMNEWLASGPEPLEPNPIQPPIVRHAVCLSYKQYFFRVSCYVTASARTFDPSASVRTLAVLSLKAHPSVTPSFLIHCTRAQLPSQCPSHA